jgi:glycosyltransferase involved in cell wall biosynthesis
VASNTAPVAEAISDGINGTLVDFFDVAAWSQTLTKTLANPAQFQPLREAARQTALDRYDLRRHCLPRMVDFVEGFAPR